MQRLPEAALRGMFGEHGESLWRRCRGIDERAVVPDHEAKSISHESTFPVDVEDVDAVRAVLMDHAEQVARRLRAKARRGRTVTVKIRFGEFETVTRSETLSEATNRTDAIWAAGRRLFDRWAQGFRPVRLIGIGVSQLTDGGEQLGLFEAREAGRRAALDAAADAINAKFGKRMLRRAGGVEGWNPERIGRRDMK
jgi:DNA polymerase-4